MNPVIKSLVAGCALAGGLSISFPLAAQTNPGDITWIPQISTPLLIDGEIDEVWHAQAAMPNNSRSSVASRSSWASVFCSCWRFQIPLTPES